MHGRADYGVFIYMEYYLEYYGIAIGRSFGPGIFSEGLIRILMIFILTHIYIYQ